MSQVWFTSDLHLGHKNIHRFGGKYRKETCQEDFEFIEYQIVPALHKRDQLYVIGDVAFGADGMHYMKALFGQINCRVTMIFGNHDKYSTWDYTGVFDRLHGAMKNYGYWITHIPIHPQEFRRSSGNIHGHIHSKELNIDDPRYFNVNWDQHGRLINLEEIRDVND